jgi:hypothetical protein
LQKKSLYIFFIGFMASATACKRYKDPDPQQINLTNKYCNNPKAVNFNWGFPGIEDNSTCIYPADAFVGNYVFYDSLQDATGIFLPEDTLPVQLTKMSDSSLLINGLCSSTAFMAKASKNLRFNLDSNTTNGQLFCTSIDTINGKGSKELLIDTTIKFTYNILTPSGIKVHKGVFKKN